MQVIRWLKNKFGLGTPRPQSRRAFVASWAEKYILTDEVLAVTHRHLNKEGKVPQEGLVYWAGWYARDMCIVTTVFVPRGESRFGGVRVPTEEMIRIAGLLRGLDLLLVAQVHTHPGDHKHSGGDDVKAVSFLPGFLSIVVPNFAQTAEMDFQGCYFHRYLGKGKWRELSRAEASRLIHIDPLRVE